MVTSFSDGRSTDHGQASRVHPFLLQVSLVYMICMCVRCIYFTYVSTILILEFVITLDIFIVYTEMIRFNIMHMETQTFLYCA
jgi:hypothetical protein